MRSSRLLLSPKHPLPNLELTPGPTPMNSVTTDVCPCCDRAKWHCPGCGTEGSWPAPTPEPAWPVQFAGACPRCKASLTLQISGYKPLTPAASALERALGLPPAAPRQRGK